MSILVLWCVVVDTKTDSHQLYLSVCQIRFKSNSLGEMPA